MLILARKVHEKIFVGDSIVITVTRSEWGQCWIGIDAPRELAIVREEVAARQAFTIKDRSGAARPRE